MARRRRPRLTRLSSRAGHDGLGTNGGAGLPSFTCDHGLLSGTRCPGLARLGSCSRSWCAVSGSTGASGRLP